MTLKVEVKVAEATTAWEATVTQREHRREKGPRKAEPLMVRKQPYTSATENRAAQEKPTVLVSADAAPWEPAGAGAQQMACRPVRASGKGTATTNASVNIEADAATESSRRSRTGAAMKPASSNKHAADNSCAAMQNTLAPDSMPGRIVDGDVTTNPKDCDRNMKLGARGVLKVGDVGNCN